MVTTTTRTQTPVGSISPNRTELSRSFPVLGFTVRTPTHPGWFEVALAADPTLFTPERRSTRTPTTFWSTKELGLLSAASGEAVFLVPTRVLAALSTNRRLFFALATFDGPGRSGRRVWRPDPATASSVGIDRTFQPERRVSLLPTRGAPGAYGTPADPPTWAGDDEPTPEPTSGSSAPSPDEEKNAMQTSGAIGQAFEYDDGLDREFWQTHARGAGAGDADSYGIDGPLPSRYEQTDFAAASAVPFQSGQASEYPQGTRFAPAATGNFLPSSGVRTIDKVVIHITDGGANINGTIRWFQDPTAQVSSHYVVGQDGEVVQMVANNDVAYHARGANSSSIGIEHVANTRGLVPTEAQYCASAALVRWLCETYGVPMDRQHILGHREAVTTSKTCPGDWDWEYFMGMITSATCYPRSAHVPAAQGMQQMPRRMAEAKGGPAAVAIVSSIVGAGMSRILDNQGDISWTLDQLNGWKHPGDVARPVATASVRNQTLNVPGPKGASVFGQDEIYAKLRIRFDYDGRSVGNISQQVTEANDAFGVGLVVTSTIHDVGQVYPSASDPNAHAAVRIEIHYRFTLTVQDDKIALRELTLFGNGTFSDTWQWM